jgi:hypothetical protein
MEFPACIQTDRLQNPYSTLAKCGTKDLQHLAQSLNSLSTTFENKRNRYILVFSYHFPRVTQVINPIANSLFLMEMTIFPQLLEFPWKKPYNWLLYISSSMGLLDSGIQAMTE